MTTETAAATIPDFARTPGGYPRDCREKPLECIPAPSEWGIGPVCYNLDDPEVFAALARAHRTRCAQSLQPWKTGGWLGWTRSLRPQILARLALGK